MPVEHRLTRPDPLDRRLPLSPIVPFEAGRRESCVFLTPSCLFFDGFSLRTPSKTGRLPPDPPIFFSGTLFFASETALPPPLACPPPPPQNREARLKSRCSAKKTFDSLSWDRGTQQTSFVLDKTESFMAFGRLWILMSGGIAANSSLKNRQSPSVLDSLNQGD